MKLDISQTKTSPFVYLSVEECKFLIKGNSYSEKSDKIFSQIHQWIDENVPLIECEALFNISLNVINSVTYKNILILVTKLSEYVKNGKDIKIIWNFNKDDEDISIIGKDIQELFEITVIFNEIQ